MATPPDVVAEDEVVDGEVDVEAADPAAAASGSAASGSGAAGSGAAPASGSAPAGPAGRSPDSSAARRLAVLATVAAIAPILLSGIRAALRGWYPVGDDAYSAVRAWDVFSTRPPLLATWSSASMAVEHQINHPGPLHFVLLAIPVRVFGHGAGTAIGMALTNALAVAAIAWVTSRRLGASGTALAMGFTALLCWSMGSEMLYEPWSQFAPLLPFAAFLVAAWCAAGGDRVALPVMVAAGSYSFQTHLSYSLLVPGVAAFVVAVVVAQTRLTARQAAETVERDAVRRDTRRWLVISAVTALVLWAPPLVEQVTYDGEGNLFALARSSAVELPTPTTEMSLRAYGGTLAVPPSWLPPSYGSPSFGGFDNPGPPLWLAAGGLLVLSAALGVLGWRALRRGSAAAAAGSAVALVTLLLGLVSTLRMPIYFGVIVPSYARFMWPLGMVVWLALAVLVHDEWRARTAARPARPAGSGRRLRVSLALGGAVVAVVGGIGAIPYTDHGVVGPPWTIDALDAIDDDVAAAGKDAGAVVVVIDTPEAALHMGPTLFGILQDADVPFYVEDEALIRQLGERRRYEPGKAAVKLVIRAGPRAAAAPEGGQLVARWTGEDLDDPAAAEQRQIMVYRVPIDA